MTVSIAAQWGSAATPAPSATPIPPGALSLPVTTTHTSANWLVAICAWRQYQAGQGVTVAVEDDAHNRWEPLGAPNADSAAAGVTRVSVWYAPAARVAATTSGATTVMCGPTGPVAALAMLVLDVAGLNPWDQLAVVPVTNYALAGTSIGLSSPVPLGGAQAIAFSAGACDLSPFSLSFSGAGWTALSTQSCTNGTDHTGDLELGAQWQLITAAQSVTWSVSPACDLAGITGALVVNPTGPAAPNPNWPIVITEAAPGAGVQTPPSQLAWQSLSHRDLSMSATIGQPYLLGGLQAAQGALMLDNPDLAVTPPGSGVWGGIDSGTPVRVRGIIPASPTPHYVGFSGFLQQAPTSFDEQLRGGVAATLTDAYAYATGYLPPVLQAELASEPSLYALWPLNDPAGSAFASNRAPGNTKPLVLYQSKNGLGSTPAVSTFGGGAGTLKGDSGSGAWAETSVPSVGNQGWSLGCIDSNYPSVTSGVTLEGWFQVTSVTPGSGDFFQLLTTVAAVLVAGWNGSNILVTGSQNAPTSQTITLTTVNPSTAPLTYYAIAFSRTAYAIYINGALASSGTWTHPLAPVFTQLWVNGTFGLAGTIYGGVYNGISQYVALYSTVLPAERIQAHYQAGLTAFAGDYAHYRVERILGYAGLTGRRAVIPEAPGMPGGFSGPVTTPPQDVTPMSSMATLGGTIPSLYTPGTPGFTPSSGTQASQALADTAASTVPAVMNVARTGAFFYYPRSYASSQTARWTVGDLTGIPVWPGAAYPYDPGRVVNNVQLTQPDTGTVTGATIAEAASSKQYGNQTYQVTAYLLDDATAGYVPVPTLVDLADWVANAGYSPRMRATFTVKASHAAPGNQAATWAFVLGASPGDIVTVQAAPPTTPGATISVTGRVMQAGLKLAMDAAGGTEGSLTVVLDIAPEYGTLTCDDLTRGVLSGVNVIGW